MVPPQGLRNGPQHRLPNFSGQSLAVIGILVRKLLASVSSYSRPKSRSDLREFGVVLSCRELESTHSGFSSEFDMQSPRVVDRLRLVAEKSRRANQLFKLRQTRLRHRCWRRGSAGTIPASPCSRAHPCTAPKESSPPAAPTACDGRARTPRRDTPHPAPSKSLRRAPARSAPPAVPRRGHSCRSLSLRRYLPRELLLPRGLLLRCGFRHSFPSTHPPSFSTGSRTPMKNCPNSAYTALTSSNRIS